MIVQFLLFWDWSCYLNFLLVIRVTNLESAHLCIEMVTRMIFWSIGVLLFTEKLSERIERLIIRRHGSKVPGLAASVNWLLLLTASLAIIILFLLWLTGLYFHPNEPFMVLILKSGA